MAKALTMSLYFVKVKSMSDNMATVWENKTAQQFAEALFAIDDINLLRNFLRDVMTEKEIIEISSRLEVARMLQAGAKYTDIVAQTKLSSRTVARISDWMKNGCNGYAVVLGEIGHHGHITPARTV
jgi:TrpR-related protein YerC/YecD